MTSEEDMNYATVWEAIADRLPDSPALRHGTYQLSWGSFEDRSARLAGALRSLGVGRGDGVAAYLYNRPEYFEIFFAALKVRAVPSNVNYRYGSGELLALLENSGARVLFFDAALRENVASVVDRAPGIEFVEVGESPSQPSLPNSQSIEDLIATSVPAVRIERDGRDQFLSYTGGTTGLPKGVLFDIGQSMRNSLWFRDLFTGRTTELGPVDYAVQLCDEGIPLSAIPASPLMHSTAFIFASLPTLTAGGLVTTLESRSLDPDELLRAIGTSRAQVVAIVGDAVALPIVRTLDAGASHRGHYDTDSLRVICSAGVAWTPPIKQRLLDHLPSVTLLDSCGSTEGVAYGIRQVRKGDPVVAGNFDAAPGLVVLDDDGRQVARGETGLLAGPTTASGYFRDPEKTAATFRVVDGVRYAMPGDLGRIELDGTVTLIGRGVTTINTGGEKVFPTEVEEAIRSLPDVDDCLVLGVADERFGQTVAALVVCRPDHHIDVEDVSRAVRNSLAGYKVPRLVHFVEQVPRLPNGKVDYEVAGLILQSDVPDSTPPVAE